MIIAVKPDEPIREPYLRQPYPEEKKEIHLVRLAERPAGPRLRLHRDPEEEILTTLFTRQPRRRRFRPSPEAGMRIPRFAGLTSAGLRDAEWDDVPGDYDGWCFEGYYSDPNTTTAGYTEWEWLWAGNYDFPAGYYYNHGDGVQHWYSAAGVYWHDDGYDGRTWYNQGYMESMGAGPTDWEVLYAHERAHQAGWQHGEGSPEVNAAYYEVFEICGC